MLLRLSVHEYHWVLFHLIYLVVEYNSLTCRMSWLMAVSMVIAGSGGWGCAVSPLTCSDSSKSCWMTSVTPSPPSDPPGAWPVVSVSYRRKRGGMDREEEKKEDEGRCDRSGQALIWKLTLFYLFRALWGVELAEEWPLLNKMLISVYFCVNHWHFMHHAIKDIEINTDSGYSYLYKVGLCWICVM